MDTAHAIALRIDPDAVPVTAQPAAPRQLDEAAARVINGVFREIQSCCPAWKQAWLDDAALAAAKKSWTKGFMAAGIRSLDQVRFGIEWLRLRPDPWVPSCGEFVAHCQPSAESLGLPEVGTAYREACANAHPAAVARWSHPAVHHAACETGFHELRTLPEEKSRRLFERAYAVTVRMLAAGEPLRAVAKGIGHDSQKSAGELADERAEQALQARMRAQGLPAGVDACRAQLRAMLRGRRRG